MGACGMIYEYALGVLGNNLMGSSHEQIFVIIGLMMFAMGVGASLQQRIGAHLIDRFLWIELTLGLAGGFSTLVIFSSFVYTDSYRVIMYAFALLIGGLIGCEIPLLIRINTAYESSLKANLSSILSMDYVGSLVGSLLFTYVLLTRMSIERISMALGCVNALLALGGLIYFWPLVRSRVPLVIGCSAVTASLAWALTSSANWMATLEQRCFEDPIVYSETTKYQHLVLTNKSNRLRLYIDGHLQFSSDDEYIYHEMLVHVPMAVAKRRAQVLILGGGDGLALREVLRYPDVASVTLVDIDPAITQLASTQPELVAANQAAFHDARVSVLSPDGIEPGPKLEVRAPTKRDPILDRTEYQLAEVHVLNLDADQFLKQVRQTFDVVIVDFPDPRSVELAKLYSVSFYQQLAARLRENAVVSIQSTSPRAAPLVFHCIGQTLDDAGFRRLPYHAMVPSFGDWGWHLAWKHGEPENGMRRRIDQTPEPMVPTRYLTAELIRASFAFGKDLAQPQRPVVANTRWRPVLMDYHARSYQ